MDNTSSFGVVGGPLSCDDLRNHNGGNSGWSQMDELGGQSFQGSFLDPDNTSFEGYGYSQTRQSRTEQSAMNQVDALRGIDEWRSTPNFPFQYRNGLTYERFGPDGMRLPLPFDLAANDHGARGDLENQNCISANMGNDIDPGSQWPHEIGNQAHTSAIPISGIDLSLVDGRFYEDCESFSADATKTNPGGGDAPNERLPCNPYDLVDHFSNGPPNSTCSRSDPVSRKTLSRATSNTTRRYHGRARHPFSSGPSETRCTKCDDDPDREHKPAFQGDIRSQKTSLKRHMREEHSGSQVWSYQCLLDKRDGSACMTVIKEPRGRRKHVETLHPTESGELPPTDADKRRPNNKTDAMLGEWFAKVPRPNDDDSL